jgi:hypothetical protein
MRSAFLSFALALAAFPAQAGPVVAPGQKLYVLKTEHFDIIFPEASRPSALRLWSMAESVYAEVAGKLRSGLPARVPVVITPDTDILNGYSSIFPYQHIVLFDASLELGWTAMSDNLRGLFLHELTHAVSLQVKAPWASFFSGVFGSWVAPALVYSPEFMVEGVTVSFESADGLTGRANDPAVRERIRQDIFENRFKTPLEASGLYDEYPWGTIFYEYGGLFSAYLQKAYGMEKYAKLWKAMGNLNFHVSLDRYEVGFYSAFRRTYGIGFRDAWAGFRNSLQIDGVADTPEVLGGGEPSVFRGGFVAGESALFWADSRGRRAMAMDLRGLKTKKLFDIDSYSTITDASRDASAGQASSGGGSGRLLVAKALATPDGRDKVETQVYDLAARRFLPETRIPRMREARFFREGVVGIVSRLHDTDLAYVAGSESRILLRGSETVMFSSPAVLDENRIALVVAVDGRRNLGILEVDSGRLSLVRPEGDERLFDYLRHLSVSPGHGGTVGGRPRLWFNYDSDDRLYKLGVLEGDELRVETTDYSGGVFFPGEAAGRVFYVGRFSAGERLCRYPGEADSLGSRRLSYSLEPFDPASALAERERHADAAAATAAVGAYRPLAYLNPFRMWAPYFDPTTLGTSFRPFVASFMQDPIEAHSAQILAGYDSLHPFADLSLSWSDGSLPVSLSGELRDNLSYDSEGFAERQSAASLSAVLPLPVFPSPRKAAVGLGGELYNRAWEEEGSPYGWEYRGWAATASALAAWYGRMPGSRVSAARGLDLEGYFDLDTDSMTRKAEAHLVASIDRVPLRLDAWGAWASDSVLELDASSDVFSSDRRPPYFEYGDLDEGSTGFLAEGTLAYRLADQAIRSELLGLYFNRLLIDVGARGAYFREDFLGSAFVRLSFDVGASFGALPVKSRLFGEAFARFNVSSSEDIFGWRLGYQFDTDAGTPVGKGAFANRSARD